MGEVIKCLLLKGIMLFVMAFQSLASDNVQLVKGWLDEYETGKEKVRLKIANNLMEIITEELAEKPIRFNNTIPTDTLNQQVWYWSAEYFYAVQDYQQALVYGQKALPLFKDMDGEADCLSLLSLIQFRLCNYNHAAEYAKRCYQIDERTGDPDIMSSSLNTLAGIYIGANQPKKPKNIY